MDISALLLACSVHADDDLMLSLAYVHGRGSPFAVVNVRPQALDELDDAGSPLAAAAARLEVNRILSTGGEPALGLLPVLPEWANEFGTSVDDLFDPCVDIAVASAKLSEFDYTCRRRGARRSLQRRSCTLELYGRSLGLPALRRAVLADLTLQNPFSCDASDPCGSTSGPTAFQLSSSGLFFAVIPFASAPSLRRDSLSLLPEEPQ